MHLILPGTGRGTAEGGGGGPRQANPVGRAPSTMLRNEQVRLSPAISAPCGARGDLFIPLPVPGRIVSPPPEPVTQIVPANRPSRLFQFHSDFRLAAHREAAAIAMLDDAPYAGRMEHIKNIMRERGCVESESHRSKGVHLLPSLQGRGWGWVRFSAFLKPRNWLTPTHPQPLPSREGSVPSRGSGTVSSFRTCEITGGNPLPRPLPDAPRNPHADPFQGEKPNNESHQSTSSTSLDSQPPIMTKNQPLNTNPANPAPLSLHCNHFVAELASSSGTGAPFCTAATIEKRA